MFSSLLKLKNMSGGRGLYVHESVPDSVDKVLDVGCSYGWTLAKLREKANELWGIDTDRFALSQAKKAYPDIKFIHQTAASLPFESNFSRSQSHETMRFSADASELLTNSWRSQILKSLASKADIL